MSNNTTTTLSDLLDQEQLTQVELLIRTIQQTGMPPTMLRDYLRTQAESLLVKGVVADYLYYSLCYRYKL